MADAALLDHYRARPADAEQMSRWLGHRDAYAEVVVHARREAAVLRERLRLMPRNWTRRRAILSEEVKRWDALATHYQERLTSVRSCYDASAAGRKRPTKAQEREKPKD